MVFNSPLLAIYMIPNKKDIESAIQQYKQYRINLVEAELIETNDTSFVVFFDGSFCETCGYFDYYEDLQVLLEDEYDVNSRIVEIKHVEKGDLVRFELIFNDSQFSL